MFISEDGPERQGSQGDPSRNKGASRRHFPSPQSQHKQQPPAETNTCYLTCLKQALSPCTLVQSPFLAKLTLVLAAGPSPRRPVQTTDHISQPASCVGLHMRQLQWWRVSFCKQTSARFVKMQPTSGWGPNTAHNRKREALQTTKLKEKEAKTQQESTRRHSLKHQALGDRGQWTAGHYRTSSP